MSEGEKQRKSGFVEFLELGEGFLKLAFKSLDFISRVLDRWPPAKLPPEHTPKSGRAQDRETASRAVELPLLGHPSPLATQRQ